MQTILIVIITVLILVAIYQARQIKRLQEKTLEAFRIVCTSFSAEPAQAIRVLSFCKKLEFNARD